MIILKEKEMEDKKIMTLHPDPTKKGVNISLKKYEMMRDTLLGIIARAEMISFTALTEEAQKELHGVFEGSIPWYVVSVKQDLEARNIIKRVNGKSPQHLTMVD